MEAVKKERNLNLDLVRCVAIFSVISVHFFLNNGFYDTIIVGKRMFCMTFMRTLFMICVPLFVLLTGYLMNKKELSAKFYKGIIQTVGIYIIISILAVLFNLYFGSHFVPPLEADTLSKQLSGILEFNTIEYAWYVEMYLGLFLLIPFLNLSYHGCKNQNQKLILITTIIFLTVPYSVCQKHVIFPDFWIQIWPVTYYFIGAYLSEYKIKISCKNKVALWFLSVTIFSIINFEFCHNRLFYVYKLSDWIGIENIIMSVTAFIAILSLDLRKLPSSIQAIITQISSLSFGIFLSSYIFDKIIYYKFNRIITSVPQKLEWYLVIVPIVFLCSMLLSYCANVIYKSIYQFVSKFRKPTIVPTKVINCDE